MQHISSELFSDTISLLFLMTFCSALGVGILSLLPSNVAKDFTIGSPVIGFGWISIFSTWCYRAGLPPVCGLYPCIILIPLLLVRLRIVVMLIKTITSRRLLIFIALTTILLVDIPNVVSNADFKVFQGNAVDQMNYLGISTSVTEHDYNYLNDGGFGPQQVNDFIEYARMFLNARPSVNIFHSAIHLFLFRPLILSPPILMVFFQLLIFVASVNFLLMLKLRVELSYVFSATCTVGFFTQFLIDINAWSQLASISQVLLIISCALRSFERLAQKDAYHLFVSLTILCTLMIAPLFYIYPEMATLVLLSLFCAIIINSMMLIEVSQATKKLIVLFFSAGLSILLCIPYYVGTLIFMMAQIRNASSQVNDWHLQFQPYIFHASVAEKDYHGVYAIFSWPVDSLYGMLGMYFLRPPADLDHLQKVAWKLLMYVPIATIAYSLYSWIIISFKSTKPTFARDLQVVCASIIACGIIIMLKSQFWTAGKLLGEFGPMMFLSVLSSLISMKRISLLSYATIAMLVTSHYAFAFARIVSAVNGSGLSHSASFYPPHINASLKAAMDFDITNIIEHKSSCHHVTVNLIQPYVDHYAQLVLASLQIPFTSARPINDYYGFIPDRYTQKQVSSDCYLSTEQVAGGPARFLLETSEERSAQLKSRRDKLVGEIAIRQLEGSQSSGFYLPERFQTKDLRWTNGNAEVNLADWGNGEGGHLSFAIWGIAPPGGTNYAILANGQKISEGTVISGFVSGNASLPIVPEGADLRIQILSRTFWTPSDPRDLGIAIQSIVLSRNTHQGDVQGQTLPQ